MSAVGERERLTQIQERVNATLPRPGDVVYGPDADILLVEDVSWLLSRVTALEDELAAEKAAHVASHDVNGRGMVALGERVAALEEALAESDENARAVWEREGALIADVVALRAVAVLEMEGDENVAVRIPIDAWRKLNLNAVLAGVPATSEETNDDE